MRMCRYREENCAWSVRSCELPASSEPWRCCSGKSTHERMNLVREDRSGQPVVTCAAKQTHLEDRRPARLKGPPGCCQITGSDCCCQTCCFVWRILSGSLRNRLSSPRNMLCSVSGMRLMTIRNICDSSSGQPSVRNDVICRQLSMLIRTGT